MPSGREPLLPRLTAPAALLALALAVYLLRVWPWASAQLWFDEVITLENYCGAFHPGTTFASVWRNYTMANNHILNTALYWGWLRLVTPAAPELLLRLPSILIGAVTILVAGIYWRRALGRRLAALAALALAASPVFPAFAYQIRGYSLSMLLAAVATGAAMNLLLKRAHASDWAALLLSLALQPLLMPSAAVLAAAIAILLAIYRNPDEPLLGPSAPRRLAAGCAAAAAGLLGLAYYLTLLPQLRAAIADAASVSRDIWPTRLASARHLLLAAACHLGPLLVPLALAPFRRIPSRHRRLAAFLLLSIAAAGTLMYLAAGARNVPFPRNSLLFLPPLTAAAFAALRACRLRHPLLPVAATLLLLVSGLAATAAADRRCTALVRRGKVPQDLLMQLYRGDTAIRDSIAILRQNRLADHAILLVSDNDSATAKWYFLAAGLPRHRAIDHTELRTTARAIHRRRPLELYFSCARLPQEAEYYFRLAEAPPPRLRLHDFPRRQLYQ